VSITKRKRGGFTLIELMIVVAIVAVLLLVALPSYQGQLIKTRRSLAAAELMQVMTRQEQFFLNHRRYAELLTQLNYPGSPYAIDVEGNDRLAAAPDGLYLIGMSSVSNGYALYAEPRFGQSADRLCGTLTLSWLGLKSVSGSGSAADCW
jgi:type IV pilus assembly protein PilE